MSLRTQRFLSVLMFCIVLTAMVNMLAQEEESRTYHKVKIADLAAHKVRHTHIQFDGWVTYIKMEADSDYHLRICDDPKIAGMDRSHCVVAEIIPTLRPKKPWVIPKVGDHVRIKGIRRYDTEVNHDWEEAHPTEAIEVL